MVKLFISSPRQHTMPSTFKGRADIKQPFPPYLRRRTKEFPSNFLPQAFCLSLFFTLLASSLINSHSYILIQKIVTVSVINILWYRYIMFKFFASEDKSIPKYSYLISSSQQKRMWIKKTWNEIKKSKIVFDVTHLIVYSLMNVKLMVQNIMK